MDSVIDSWLINPSSSLNDNNNNNNNNNSQNNIHTPTNAMNLNTEDYLNNNTRNNNNPNNNDFNLNNYAQDAYHPDQQKGTTISKDVYDISYNDIDNLLTQELRDLDIPMAPSPNENQFDWKQNILTTPQQIQLKHSKKPSMAHKRGLSGTAIFGFANHNKTLSISSLQKTILDISKDPNLNDMMNNYNTTTSNYSKDSSNKNYMTNPNEILNNKANDPANDQLSRLILNQQEELRLALQKQKEVNRKLEQQLRENQMQQEKIQKVLDKQEMTAQQLVPPPSSSPMRTTISPQIIRTPAKSNTLNPQDDPLIITSNSASGKYQFPPPTMASPSMSPMNGSPSRGHYNRSRNMQMNNLQLQDNYNTAPPAAVFDTYRSPEKANLMDGLKTPNNESIPHNNSNGSYRKNQPFTPISSVPSSSSHSNNNVVHYKKESVISTVSTIPQQDESEYLNKMNNNDNLLGLGLQLPDPGRNQSKIDVLPTIRGSTENTPIKSRFPKKYTFQHTPVKNQSPLRDPYESNGPLSKQVFLHGTPERVIAQPPPPIEFNSSPMKITKKPSTLPPGSIDRYVKEIPGKLFQCLYPDCGKIFKRRYNVRSHIQTHLQDRPYECDYEGCHKAFVRNHDLVRHKKAHAAKMYACPCGKRFNKESALLSHRSKLTCSGGKKFDVSITKSSSPIKYHGGDLERDINTSPIKENIQRDKTGYVLTRMEEQLSNEIEKYGLLKPPNISGRPEDVSLMLTLSPPSGLSDFSSP